MKITRRFGIVLLVLTLIASGCGSDRGEDESGQATTTAAGGEGGEDGASGDGEMFGTLDSPCGDGDATGSPDQGVTDESIAIGYGDDSGFAAQPGLNQELGDTTAAMIEWCNEQGGINGRQIEGTRYDGKFTEIVNVYTEACAKEFFLVGQTLIGDDQGEPTRRECGLPTVAASAVSYLLANGPLFAQPTPNPVDYATVSEAEALKELFPEEIQNGAVVVANYASSEANTNKVIPAFEDAGFEFPCRVVYDIAGVPDWKPFVQQLKDCGAEFAYFVGQANPGLQGLLEAADQLDYHPIWLTDLNNYDSAFAQWNTDGFADNVYMRLNRGFIEEADEVPAIQTYLDIIGATDIKASPLGESAASAFLLWATAADACGADLTRDCVMEEIGNIHEWDAGGLQAPEDPGANLPGECGMLIKLTGTEFERVTPEEPGTWDCDPSYRVEVTDSPDVEAANLDEDRIAQLP